MLDSHVDLEADLTAVDFVAQERWNGRAVQTVNPPVFENRRQSACTPGPLAWTVDKASFRRESDHITIGEHTRRCLGNPSSSVATLVIISPSVGLRSSASFALTITNGQANSIRLSLCHPPIPPDPPPIRLNPPSRREMRKP